jgi:hypothetical protein
MRRPALTLLLCLLPTMTAAQAGGAPAGESIWLRCTGTAETAEFTTAGRTAASMTPVEQVLLVEPGSARLFSYLPTERTLDELRPVKFAAQGAERDHSITSSYGLCQYRTIWIDHLDLAALRYTTVRIRSDVCPRGEVGIRRAEETTCARIAPLPVRGLEQ